MTRTETWGPSNKPFDVTGHYFELLKTVNPVNVKAYDSLGHMVANESGVEAGFFIDRRGLSAFQRLEIETISGSESVTFLYSDGTTGTKRPNVNWYDRNPISRGKSFSVQNTGPVAIVTRWTYTVPAGKKAIVENALCEILRFAQSLSNLPVEAYQFVTCLDASTCRISHATLCSNVLGQGGQSLSGSQIVMQAGETLTANTEDQNVGNGGAMNFWLHAKITEYNA